MKNNYTQMEENKEEAVPFLIYDQNTKIFTLTEQGEEVIKNLNSHFGVISVAGMYRTGKSYLLNRMLLNRQKGFSVGPTVNPCTKGLWIWSKPIYGSAEDGSRIPVLLIDTEGFGAFDEDQNHDIRIFTLSILLSSFFCFNSVGSIDENALQSLSFVINLSKHIQLNSNTETDPEELANLFPSFLWVLRDFSLQLVDENGESITPKEYLEKVLDVTKTFYEQDQKNKIRKLIKTYFKDRDCFTMVRPLLKEKELQCLETLGPEKLRPEFLEQILQLRKRILSRVRVKTFKGKPLTGEMYLGLIKSLINSMNTGRVPNIENTWQSMCKVECYKAFEEAERIYEIFIRESFEKFNGLSDGSINEIHSNAKEKCIEAFRQKALGDVSDEYEKQLKIKIKEKFSYYSRLNEEETKNNMIRVLQKWYSILENKIHANELRSFDDIECECKQLEQKLYETFPYYGLRNELFNDFKAKILSFAGDFTINKMNNEVKLIKNENTQVINKMNQDMSEIKSSLEKEISKKNSVIEMIKSENSDLKDQLNEVQDKLIIMQRENEIKCKVISSQMERIKEEYERKLVENQTKLNNVEEKQKESERKAITIQAEAEREKALLDQKIEHYSKQIEEYSKREKDSSTDLKSQLKEQTIAYKENVSKLESQIKSLTHGNENLKERILDLESMLGSNDHLHQSEKSRADELSVKLSQVTKELNERISTMKKQTFEDKTKFSDEIKVKENDFNSKINKLKIKNEELELTCKNLEDNYKNHIQKLEKENAILRQENEFIKVQKEELQNQMEEQKRNYENIISTLENKTFSMVGHDEFQKKVDEIKLYFETEKKTSEESYEKSKQLYISQIDKLTERLNESEYKAKVELEEMERELNEARNKAEKTCKELSQILNEKKNLNENLKNSQLETLSKFKALNEEYELKLEEKEHVHQREIADMNRNSEETISQLKALFETEKIRFEEKMKEEKSRQERKIKNTIEDYEMKLKESESELKEELENLQTEYNELEAAHQTYISNTEQEINILNQRIEALEGYLKDSKEAHESLQAQSIHNLEMMTDAFNKERKDFMKKIEVLTNEVNNKEKELAAAQLKRDTLERIISEKENGVNQMRKEFEDEKKDLQQRLETLRTKNQESNDEFMVKKLEFTRENALLNQQIEFLNKKIEDLNSLVEEGQKRYEERLFGLRSEVERDLNEKFERVTKAKDELEAKLLQKKKEVKELEQTFIKQNKLLEKEKTELNEKCTGLEIKLKELGENYEKELSSLASNLQTYKEENSTMKDQMFNGDDYLKKKVIALESELQEKTATLEKEHILWDGKIKFIEQQRDTLKKDLAEAQKRFENLLENIQKKANLDKEKLENANQNAISNLELKYQNQIKDMQESHHKLYTELMTTNKELDRELKAANIQLNRGKSYDSTLQDKRLAELVEEKEALKKEITEIRKEKDAKLSDIQSLAEKEKDILKNKATEIETRLRELEGKRGALLLEYEKDKTKWSLEKDHFSSKLMELQEQVDRLERKNETLLRENEKLKTDKNNLKKSSIGKNFSSLIHSSIGGNQTNSSTFVPLGRDKEYTPSKNYQTTNDPYQKEISKIIGSSVATNLLNDLNSSTSSRTMNTDKSFDRYDSSKYDNPYNKYLSNYAIKNVTKEENGNSTENNSNNK